MCRCAASNRLQCPMWPPPPPPHQHHADQVEALVWHARVLARAVHKPQPLRRRARRPAQGALPLQVRAHSQHVRRQVNACAGGRQGAQLEGGASGRGSRVRPRWEDGSALPVAWGGKRESSLAAPVCAGQSPACSTRVRRQEPCCRLGLPRRSMRACPPPPRPTCTGKRCHAVAPAHPAGHVRPALHALPPLTRDFCLWECLQQRQAGQARGGADVQNIAHRPRTALRHQLLHAPAVAAAQVVIALRGGAGRSVCMSGHAWDARGRHAAPAG